MGSESEAKIVNHIRKLMENYLRRHQILQANSIAELLNVIKVVKLF